MRHKLCTLLFAFFVLCGTSTSVRADSSQPPVLVGLFADMPACDALHDRWVYFVEDATAAGDCTAGSGSDYAICTCHSATTTWAASGGGGSTTTNNNTYYSETPLRYNPFRTRTDQSATASDDFLTSISSSWSWQNQSTSTDTWANGSAVMTIPASGSVNHRVRCLPAPTGTDFTVTSAVRTSVPNGGNRACTFVVVTGTEASPTRTEGICEVNNAGGQIDHGTWTDYAGSGGSQRAIVSPPPIPFGTAFAYNIDYFLRFRYVTSTKALTSDFSTNGSEWTTVTTTTLAQDPISVCRMMDSANGGGGGGFTAYWDMFRTCTSTDCTTSPYPIGDYQHAEATANTTHGPEGTEYSPLRQRSDLDMTRSDFFNDSLSAIWTATNFGTSTQTIIADSSVIAPQTSSAAYHEECVAGPGAVDFWSMLRMRVHYTSSFQGAGITFVTAGTMSTPTNIETLRLDRQSSTEFIEHVWEDAWAPSTGGARANFSPGSGVPDFITHYYRADWWWLLFRYITSTKVLASYWSINGYEWYPITTVTIANDPIAICYGARDDSATAFTATFGDFRTCSTPACMVTPVTWDAALGSVFIPVGQ